MSVPLRFAALSAAYREQAILTDVNAEFPAGRVIGLVGPNGAGKTSLFRTALGLLRRLSGEVRVLDRASEEWSRDALARAVAYLPQGVDAHWPVSAERLVALGRLPHRTGFGRESEADRAAVQEALERCDALQFADRRIDELSSGERARVLLARALATRAPVLLVDEPAAHLDPAHQLRLMELLREEAGRGTAVGVTLHDLALAARFCDALVVVEKGRVVAQGPAETVLSASILAGVFGVEAWNPALSGEPAPVVPWRRVLENGLRNNS